LVVLVATGCAASRPPPNRSALPGARSTTAPALSASPVAKPAPPRPSCDYRVTAPPEPPYVARVVARCTGDVRDFGVTARSLAPFVTRGELVRGADGTELTYSVDLEGLAAKHDEVDVARRFGRSLLAPASSFLLRPEPDQDEVPIAVHFDSPGVES